jgi:hypothetical protein
MFSESNCMINRFNHLISSYCNNISERLTINLLANLAMADKSNYEMIFDKGLGSEWLLQGLGSEWLL